MKYFKKILGDRIYLSPMNIEDAEKFTKWMNDFNVTDGINSSSKIMGLEAEKEWIENVLKENQYVFAIVKKETDELIGNCSIINISHKNRIGTLGIMIGEEENRNKGYGQETLKLLLDYGFNYLNLNNIGIDVLSFNERAVACYKKLGFKEIGRRRETHYINGKYYDHIMLDMLSREFEGDYIRNKNI